MEHKQGQHSQILLTLQSGSLPFGCAGTEMMLRTHIKWSQAAVSSASPEVLEVLVTGCTGSSPAPESQLIWLAAGG